MQSAPTDTLPLNNYKGLNFALYRQALRTDVSLDTFSTQIDPTVVDKQAAASAMSSGDNLALLTSTIIRQNSMELAADPAAVQSKVDKFMSAWINMGRFDRLNSFISIQHLVNYYNKEFVREFAEAILPVDVLKVKSVTNPNGMYAQQSRTLSYESKPPPFWERALYKRLEDRVRDVPMDETEGFFYKFEISGKKMPEQSRIGDLYEREAPEFRMLPRY